MLPVVTVGEGMQKAALLVDAGGGVNVKKNTVK